MAEPLGAVSEDANIPSAGDTLSPRDVARELLSGLLPNSAPPQVSFHLDDGGADLDVDPVPLADLRFKLCLYLQVQVRAALPVGTVERRPSVTSAARPRGWPLTPASYRT